MNVITIVMKVILTIKVGVNKEIKNQIISKHQIIFLIIK